MAKIRVCFFLYQTAPLSKRVNDNKVISFFEFDDRVPFLTGGNLLHPLLDVAPVEPKV